MVKKLVFRGTRSNLGFDKNFVFSSINRDKKILLLMLSSTDNVRKIARKIKVKTNQVTDEFVKENITLNYCNAFYNEAAGNFNLAICELTFNISYKEKDFNIQFKSTLERIDFKYKKFSKFISVDGLLLPTISRKTDKNNFFFSFDRNECKLVIYESITPTLDKLYRSLYEWNLKGDLSEEYKEEKMNMLERLSDLSDTVPVEDHKKIKISFPKSKSSILESLGE